MYIYTYIYNLYVCIYNIAYIAAQPDAVRVEARVGPMFVRVSLARVYIIDYIYVYIYMHVYVYTYIYCI